MSIILFSGGRGNKNLLKAIIENKSFKHKLGIIVNGLDDGASTGSIREIFDDKVHGISDFLKVALALSSRNELIKILEGRLPDTNNYQGNLKLLNAINTFISSPDDIFIFNNCRDLDKYRAELQLHLSNFLEFVYKKYNYFPDMGDYKIGNIVFASLLIENSMDFQEGLISFMKFLGIDSNKYKILQSSLENSYLVGLLKNGSLLPNEASVVLTRTSDFIEKTFQIPRPLSAREIRLISSKELEEKISVIKEIEYIPKANNLAITDIQTSKAIIYGPGTPYSSLLPSLELSGISDAIKSVEGPKILVSNLVKETSNTITVENLVENMMEYISRSASNEQASLSDYLTHIIVPDNLNNSEEGWILVNPSNIAKKYNSVEVVTGKIRSESDPSKHDGNELLKIIMKLIDG